MVNRSLKDNIMEVCPMLEIFNDRAVKEFGISRKMKNQELKMQLINLTSSSVGTHAGDKLIAEGRNDNELQMRLLKKQLAALEAEQE